ncbi:lamin tail domain-containing protein 2 [Mantella aurantiaca]
MENGVAPYRTASYSQVSKDDWGDRKQMTTILEQRNSPCPLKIVEVNSLGHFVRVVNASPHQDVDMSGYILWQLEGGHPVSMFRFPQNLILPAYQHVTVWASAPKVSHNPPTDLLWKGRVYFRSNPKCVTVLSRPNGQPVAFHKTEESPPLYTSVRKSVSQNQKIRRWPIENQHQYNYNPQSPAVLPRRHSISAKSYQDSRAPQNMCNSAKTIQQLSPSFRNSDTLAFSSAASRLLLTESVLPLIHAPLPPNSAQEPLCAFIRRLLMMLDWEDRLNADSPLVRLVAQKTARSRHGFKFLSQIPFTCDLLRV